MEGDASEKSDEKYFVFITNYEYPNCIVEEFSSAGQLRYYLADFFIMYDKQTYQYLEENNLYNFISDFIDKNESCYVMADELREILSDHDLSDVISVAIGIGKKFKHYDGGSIAKVVKGVEIK